MQCRRVGSVAGQFNTIPYTPFRFQNAPSSRQGCRRLFVLAAQLRKLALEFLHRKLLDALGCFHRRNDVRDVLLVALHKHVHVVASELVQSVAAHLQIGLLEPFRHGGRRLVLLRLCFAAAIVSGVLRDEVGTHLASELACGFLPQLAEAEAFLFFEVRVVSLF